MRIFFILMVFFLPPASLQAQKVFLEEGTIEYERRINVWATLEDTRYGEDIRTTTPQFRTDHFQLRFQNQESIWSFLRSGSKESFGSLAALKNTVYTNWNQKKYIAIKDFFEENFTIADSLRNIRWKLTNDFREIAGFTCRRATAIIMDSVFVVAFYTDEIELSGGPEGFSGLPGAILGLVINRLHTSWYATKVEAKKIPQLISPATTNALTRRELHEKLGRFSAQKTAEQSFNYRHLLL